MKFEGSFEENCMETSVPQLLIELVSMVEHSPDIETKIETETTKSDLLHIAEWQSTKKETPLPRSYTNVQLILQLVHHFPKMPELAAIEIRHSTARIKHWISMA